MTAAQTLSRRAVEAVSWGMPAVNFDLMYQAMVRLGGAYNEIVYWSRLPSWKNETLTPNPDTIYVMPFISTRDAGPMVLEIPPAGEGSITGSIDDCWQTAIEDVGPAGADKGNGGKYVILPPGDDRRLSDEYIALPASTYQSYALLRSIVADTSEKSIAKAVTYGKRIRLYPLSQANNPQATRFIDVIEETFDAAIPYDVRFFQSLDRIVQYEPWLARDRVMIDQLKSIGIEKGKEFNPDDKTEQLLGQAARDARECIDERYERAFSPAYFENTRWALPVDQAVIKGLQTNFADVDSYPIDGRGVMYSMGFFSAKNLGAGQFYLMTVRDANGRPLNGAKSYRLSVPANAPVKQYWSATAYDRATHTLIRGLPWSSRSSQTTDLEKNADGSVVVYFGPHAPAAGKANWVPTSPNGDFEVLFRLYGPEKPLFDKTWRLPDIEELP